MKETFDSNRKLRLACVVTHPIQYQVPLFRRLAQEPDIDLTVFFCSDHSVRGYTDSQFGGVQIKWDIPLLGGYHHEFLPNLRRSPEVSFFSPLNRGFYRALKKGRFDAVWIHGYWSFNCICTMIAAKLLGIPVLDRVDATLTARHRSRLTLLTKRVFFSVARHFIAAVLPVGLKNQEYWAHYLGPEFPSFMTPYAVDNAYFHAAASRASGSREDFRRQLNLEPGRPVVLYASKLMPGKRCMDLIDALLGMKRVADGKRPYLLVVGDGAERAACEARVRSAGESGVRFFGFQNQSQLPRFFDLCDVFVFPSVYESFGLIVNEVMNAGKPIIVSDEVGCQRDLVTDGVNGRVFPAGDIEALRTAIEDILADLSVREEMGRHSLQRINQWSFEEDIRGLREALNFVADLRLTLRKTVLARVPTASCSVYSANFSQANLSGTPRRRSARRRG
jgi:glycosyltransferase involved in cell wall biosynthesis